MKTRDLRRKYLPFLPSGSALKRVRDHFLRSLRLAPSYTPHFLIDHPELRIDSPLTYLAGDHLLSHGELRFLQIGAFDGSTCDDLQAIIKKHDCKGVLVEPQPFAYKKLQEKYADSPEVTLVNAAIDTVSGDREFYLPKQGASLVSSFDRNHLLKHGVPSHEITSQTIQCLTVKDLLEQSDFSHFDLIQIDAEGYDYQIVKSILDQEIEPEILRFEFVHIPKADLKTCLEILAERGYRFLTERKDVIAIKESSKATSKNLSAAA